MNKSITVTLKFIFAGIILWFLTHTAQLNFNLFLYAIKNPSYVFYILLMFYIMTLLSALRWYKLNNAQLTIYSFKQTLLLTYFGLAFNNILPGTIGGDFIRVHLINKDIPHSKSKIILSVIVDRVIGFMSIFTILFLFGVFQFGSISHHLNFIYLIKLCTIIFIIVLIAFILSIILPKQIGVSKWLLKKFPTNRWATSAISLLNAIRTYRQCKKILIESLLISILIQLLMVMTIYLICTMMHLPYHKFLDLLFATALIQIVNMIPLSPGGIGFGEIAFSHILLLLNPVITVSYATVFLAYRLFGIVSYIPGVILFFFKFKLNKQIAISDQPI